MTAPEYLQLKAFARIDGVKLALLWTASFACYVEGLSNPVLTLAALFLALLTPVVIIRMVRRFRDDALEGAISIGRGWGYVVFLFLYAGLLFAAVQFVYFAFIDKGHFVSAMTQMMSASGTAPADSALAKMVGEGIAALSSMRPIDISLNILTTNLMIGCVMGLPIAAVCKVKKS